MMKRMLCILCVAALAASITALAVQQSDSSQTGKKGYRADGWAGEPLSQAKNAGLIPESLSGADLTEAVTRQDYAAAAVALYEKLTAPGTDGVTGKETAPSDGGHPFSDTTDSLVEKAARLGLVEGTGGGRFDPTGVLTREQAAVILARLIDAAGVKLPGLCGTNYANLADREEIASWAREGAALMSNLGVIQGKPGTASDARARFDPRGTLTAQETLVMNQRLAEQAENWARDAEEQDRGSFAGSLLRAVDGSQPNNTLSPISLQYALGLLQAGAQGETRQQLDALLTGVDFSAWNRALTTRDGGPVVEVANSLWFAPAATPKQTYLDTVRREFDARSEVVDLTSQSGIRTVNSWVAEKTHDLIRTILDAPLDRDAAAVLLNALYFKGEWATAFDPANTYDQTFCSADGSEKKVPFLHDTRHGMAYIDTDTCTGVALPYRGNGWWMLALTPKNGAAPKDLAGENFTALLGNARDAYVSLSLPKLTLEGSYDLTEPLKTMGLTAAFVPSGDFEPMGTSDRGPLVLSQVIQKTYLRVDEEGTEAAAVTAAVLECGSALETEPPIQVTFDHPFLCVLWNDGIGQPLFLSAVDTLG